MKLYESEIGMLYLVRAVKAAPEDVRSLAVRGVNEGAPLLLLNKKGSGTVLIKVRGTRLALGKTLAEGIEVAEAPEA